MEVWLWVWVLIRWDSVNETFNIKSDWVAMNITGWTVIFSIKKNINDTTYINTQTATITNAVNWTCTIAIDKSITATWDLWGYYWDIQYTDSAWKRFTPQRAIFQLVYDIT